MRRAYFFIIYIVATSCGFINARSAVTYTFSGGRLGDNLISYCHAKWISYKYQIPLLYRPFAYSDQLLMHYLEDYLDDKAFFKESIILTRLNIGQIDPNADILYIVPFFCESIVERENPAFLYLFETEWNNQQFKKELEKMICPLVLLNSLHPPENILSVALHVRIGTGFDIPSLADYTWIMNEKWVELKFPPLSFYIQAIHYLVNLFPDQKIYIYLFTDHDNPKELADFFEQSVDCSRIIFDYKKEGNRYDRNVLEDFFSLTNFHCLIRADSNFSFIASRISNYRIQISPWHNSIINGEHVIDEMLINNEICKFIH